MIKTLFLLTVCIIFNPISSFADNVDPYDGYTRDIQKEADANTVNVFEAYGNHMPYRIKQGLSEGIVIDGTGDYADGKVHVDGIGAFVINKWANVGPIFNDVELKNTNVYFNNAKK